jgi:cytochrome oxidase Cu insertion factor (SCO1/SenC/PrrC family)
MQKEEFEVFLRIKGEGGEKMNGKLLAISTLSIILLASVCDMAYGALTIPSKAPNFTLTDIDGHTFSLSDYSGQTVLLTFFYTR